MPRAKLTAKLVENVKPPVGKDRIEHFDTLVPGFALRVTDRGARSWVVFYRVHGRLRRYTIGGYPAVDLGDARDQAREAIRLASKGIDAAALKAQARDERPAEPDTFEDVAKKFIERYAKPKNRSWRETERLFENHVAPKWGKRPIGTITRRDVIELLDGLVDAEMPYAANRVLAAVRKLFGWALERDIVPASPTAGVKAPGKEVKRDRVLTDDELVEVWQAAESLAYPFGAFVHMLFLTAQRRDEVAGMRRGDVDREEALWTLPRELTKSDRANEVPLSRPALRLFKSLPVIGEAGFAFTSSGAGPVSGYSKFKDRLDAKILEARAKAQGKPVDEVEPMPDWRLHDIRRTVASGMARLGVAPHVVEKLLNHTTGELGGVAGVYNRHGYLPEKRKALDRWAAHVERLLSGAKAGAKVVQLHG